MSTTKNFHCIVDDTALITNIEEIEGWVMRSALALVVPLHTIERLHLLKKDASQIGQNARKAVKFLDDITSDTKLASAVVIQEAEERYATWAEVEAHYVEKVSPELKDKPGAISIASTESTETPIAISKDIATSDDGILSQLVLTKLNTTKQANVVSPVSTPPLSPSSSDPQSSKTSPEVKTATMIANDVSPVPPSLKDLINSVVWYTHEKGGKEKEGKSKLLFLTNSSDTSYLARDFGVTSKNIHQLRASIGKEGQGSVTPGRSRNASTKPLKPDDEPRTLFRYEDEESDEEEVVFKPRGRGASRAVATAAVRGNNAGSARSKNGHSPANSLSAPQPVQNKPQIPIEEIDPDSFDRGSFARGSTPLASIGNHSTHQYNGYNRGQSTRGSFATGGHSRGGFHRGGSRGGGLDRGSARGRGRLFVP